MGDCNFICIPRCYVPKDGGYRFCCWVGFVRMVDFTIDGRFFFDEIQHGHSPQYVNDYIGTDYRAITAM
ncbi:hypothetical protein D3C86_1973440 [compost metagenome]